MDRDEISDGIENIISLRDKKMRDSKLAELFAREIKHSQEKK